jgi:BirA family biotin operon repressor/biotin-[acetyl-CoA-carboxylase] ligase
MSFSLGAPAARAGHRLRAFEQIGSTNAEAMALGQAGEPGPLWVVSKHQTSGRGRRGRDWATPPGNLAASLLRTLDLAPAKAATIGFVAGLALRDALGRIAPTLRVQASPDGVSSPSGTRFELKWPNDVLADGAKLAGILIESETIDTRRILVVGIGVNVMSAPGGVPYPATSLADLGYPVSAEALFEALTESWVAFEAIWDEGRGMRQIRDRWLAEAAGLGRPVAVRLGTRVIRGTFETIDEAGQLVVRTRDGAREVVAAGDIHFGIAASERVEA